MRVAWLASLALLVGCAGERGPQPSAPPPGPSPIVGASGPEWFAEVAADSGIDFSYRNGEESDHRTILESLGGGVAVFDFDNDGLDDIFIVGGGKFAPGEPFAITGLPDRLYRNLGNWKFQDVTRSVGLGGGGFYGHGAAACDYDGDGWTDLLVTGYGGLTLHRNNRGRFENTTARAGLGNPAWATSAAWGDLDLDGKPDLYICQYVEWSPAIHAACPSEHAPGGFDVCPPQKYRALPHFLYRNRGDGTFEDMTTRCGVRADGKGLGVLIADLDLDGRPDIYVANDATDNFLYLNRGGWKFEESGVVAGVARDENGGYDGSMGVDVGNIDGSGRPSILVTNFQDEWHAFYRNMGGGRFLHHSQAMGLASLGRSFVGFGVAVADFNLDGMDDAVIAHGHVLRYPKGSTVAQQPVLMRGTNAGSRRTLTRSGDGGPYFALPHSARGMAAGDFDLDGRLDLVVSHINAPVALLRNVSPMDGRAWVGFQGIAPGFLVLEPGNPARTLFGKAGGSYLSSGSGRLVLGFHSAGPAPSLEVWAGGRKIGPAPRCQIGRYGPLATQ